MFHVSDLDLLFRHLTILLRVVCDNHQRLWDRYMCSHTASFLSWLRVCGALHLHMQNSNSRRQLFGRSFLHAPSDTSGSLRLLCRGAIMNMFASRGIGDAASHNALPQSSGEPLVAHHNTKKGKRPHLDRSEQTQKPRKENISL